MRCQAPKPEPASPVSSLATMPYVTVGSRVSPFSTQLACNIQALVSLSQVEKIRLREHRVPYSHRSEVPFGNIS